MVRATKVVGKWVSAAGDRVPIRIHTPPETPKHSVFPDSEMLKCVQDSVVVHPPPSPHPARAI